MNKFSYYDLILLFLSEKNSKKFWEELNSIIRAHNIYFRRLNIQQRIKLASETGISSIQEKDYNSFDDLRRGIISFSSDLRLDDLELLILTLRRCNSVYSYKIGENIIEEVKSPDNFVAFINKIDEYIGNFTYDEIFAKPDFFLEFSDPNIQNFINGSPPTPLMHFSQNENINRLNLDSNILESKKASGDDLDDFSQKKQFYDLNTDFISRNEVFLDTRQDLIFKFQYLVNDFFNTFIDQYIKKNKLQSDDIYFIYKGGTFMKILFTKYKELLKDNNSFISSNADYFKRSDSDYALFINGRFSREEYTKHYYWMNIMTYNILSKITPFYNNNLSEILPINNITEDSLKKQLENINKLLWDDRSRTDVNTQNKLKYFNGIKEFIGISIGDKKYMKEEIPEKFNLYVLKSSSLTDESDSKIKQNNEYVDKSFLMKKYRKIPVERNSFYITVKEQDSNYYQALCNIPESISYESGVYQYYNETNRFATSIGDKINYFTLHRVKLNIVLYFKTWSKYDTNVRYGFFQCPAELIDIPISTFDDFKKDMDFGKYIQKYENKTDNKTLVFNAYSIYGTIDDILKALFIEQDYPWGDKKYEKKINRLVYFFMIYLNNSYQNMNDIKEKLIKFLNDYNLEEALKIVFKSYGNKESNTDELYEKILKEFSQLNKRVQTSGNEENKNKINSIKEIFLKNIDEFKPVMIDEVLSDEGSIDVPYLKKYLKYKQKYLSVKNK